MREVSRAYTRGDAIDAIDENMIQPSIKRFVIGCEEIDKLQYAGNYFFGEKIGRETPKNMNIKFALMTPWTCWFCWRIFSALM